MTSQKSWCLSLLTACSIFGASVTAADPSIELLLGRKPVQKDVEYETPKPDEFAKCKRDKEQKGKMNGWVVIGPSGQVLRKYIDTDGDGKLDQYRFYNHGIEVYRDLDTNQNDKIDQYRWLNRGGTRWGISLKEDGHIDQWKVLSAAEASKEAIRAMIAGDAASLQAVMITADDLKSVGMNPQLATRLLESASDAGKKAQALMAKSKVMTPQSRWSLFDAQLPSTIPVDEEKANTDLLIYESANAIIETPRKDPTKIFDAVQIGEMIRVGEVWKLTQVPTPIEGEGLTTSPILMEPLQIASNATQTGPSRSPKVDRIINELQDLEKDILQPNQTAATVKKLMVKRGGLLRDAIELAETDEEKMFLTKQNIDGLALAAQVGTYPDGIIELKAIESEYAKKAPKSPILPYVAYRLIQAEYAVASQEVDDKDDKKEDEKDDKKDDRKPKKKTPADLQKEWLKSLESFVERFPNADDTDDAMYNLGNHEEFQGRTDEAAAWYQKVVTDRPKSELVERSKGALRRMKLTGQPLSLKGPLLTGGNFDLDSLKGKIVLVVFWNGDFKLCADDVPPLRALYQDNKAKGFEIVGVPLENEKTTAQAFVKTNNISWPQIFVPGGQNNPLGVGYGIVSYPTMFLVGKDGKVINRNATIADVKNELPDLLKVANTAQVPQKALGQNPQQKNKPK